MSSRLWGISEFTEKFTPPIICLSLAPTFIYWLFKRTIVLMIHTALTLVVSQTHNTLDLAHACRHTLTHTHASGDLGPQSIQVRSAPQLVARSAMEFWLWRKAGSQRHRNASYSPVICSEITSKGYLTVQPQGL